MNPLGNLDWKPGVSGNPSGVRHEKILTDALRLEANATIKAGKFKGQKKLRVAARRVVDRAVDGDLAAFNVMMDRFEGKPMQSSETRVELGASELFLEVLRQMNRPRELADQSGNGGGMTGEMKVINAVVSPESASDKA